MWDSCLVKGVATLRCLPILFVNILQALFLFSGTVTALFIIISGIRFILAGGDAKQLDNARKTFTFAIIGLLVILFSYLILTIITTVTGTSCLVFFSPFTPGNCTGNVVR